MKDEELFKAWKSEQYKDQSDEERFEFVEHLHNFPKYFETTFLAGLKAGRPQWHDLRKDPTDLPKEGTEVLNDDGVKVVRINGHWRYVYGSEWEDDAHLDHWCEIPTFDKEVTK